MFDFTKLNELLASLNEEVPVKLEDGGIFKDGVNAELDELRNLKSQGKNWIINYQTSLREKLGIPNLKVKYHKIFAYCIEVSPTHTNKVPDYFIKKQELTNTTRYQTEELINYQEKLLNAETEIIKLETQLFLKLCQEISKHQDQLLKLSKKLAYIDVISSFSKLAETNNYVKPKISKTPVLKIKKGRHPVVETIKSPFIYNDCEFNEQENFKLLTGPNMSGKSTFLRQNALIIYLSQIGSFVPAESAEIGVCDSIFTRIGASDNLSAGESTFMVEMLETAKILNKSTKNSFIVLDELGRGTSTFDGLALAWAICEYIHNKIKARTLFATHYHELIETIKNLRYAENYSVSAVKTENNNISFLHQVIKGGSPKSYGIEVAKLAGIPSNILTRAEIILKNLETKSQTKKSSPVNQLSLLEELETNKKPDKIKDKLQNLDINSLTPLEALNTLAEIKNSYL